MYAAHFDTFFAWTPVIVKNVRKWTGLAETFLPVNEMGYGWWDSGKCNVYTFRS